MTTPSKPMATNDAARALSEVRFTDDDLRVIVQDWSIVDPDQAVAINLSCELLEARERLACHAQHFAGLEAEVERLRELNARLTEMCNSHNLAAAKAEAALAEARAVGKEYNDLILHMNAGGDFHEFCAALLASTNSAGGE